MRAYLLLCISIVATGPYRESHKETTSWVCSDSLSFVAYCLCKYTIAFDSTWFARWDFQLVLISNLHHHLISDPDNRLGGLTDGFDLGMNMLLGGDKEDDGGSSKSHGKSGNRKKHLKNSKKRKRH